MPSKKLILCFGPSVRMQGGISSHIERLLKLSDSGELAPYQIKAVSTVVPGKRMEKLFRIFFLLISLPVMLLQAKAVYINSATHYSWYRKGAIAILSSLLRKPVFMQLHGGALAAFLAQQSGIGKLFSRVVFRNLTCALVFTQEHEALAREWGGKSVERLDNFSEGRGELRDRYFKGDSLRIAYVGGLLKEKGLFELLDALKLLIENGCHFTVDCVGDGPERNALFRRCEELNIADRVRFHGWVSGDSVLNLLKEEDVLVLPSYFEAQPLVVIEAMMSGCLVVASNVGDVSRMLSHGQCGYILENISPSCIADAVDLIDRSRPADVAIKACYRAGELFSVRAFSTRFKEVFSKYGV